MSDSVKQKPEFRELLKADRNLLLEKPNLAPKLARAAVAYRAEAGECGETIAPGGWYWFKLTLSHQATMRECPKGPNNLPPASGSLRLLATVLHKNARTIRRYCEAGLIPQAVRIKSGHWRINYNAITEGQYSRMLKRLKAWTRERGPVTAIKKRRSKLADGHSAGVWQAHSAAAISDANGARFPEEMDETCGPVPEKWIDTVGGDRKLATLLLVAVMQCRRAGIQMNATRGFGKVATRLGNSRATLYRRYTPKQLRDAVRQAYDMSPEPGGAFDNDETEEGIEDPRTRKSRVSAGEITRALNDLRALEPDWHEEYLRGLEPKVRRAVLKRLNASSPA